MTNENVLGWIGYVPQEHILFSKQRGKIFYSEIGKRLKRNSRKRLKLQRLKRLRVFTRRVRNARRRERCFFIRRAKQRISIARAVIQNPEILILDDSLSAVDARTEAAIIENIRTERSGKTTIITTHRLSAVQHADWILVMDEGEVIEEGTHNQLIQKGGWYAEQFERQQGESESADSGVKI